MSINLRGIYTSGPNNTWNPNPGQVGNDWYTGLLQAESIIGCTFNSYTFFPSWGGRDNWGINLFYALQGAYQHRAGLVPLIGLKLISDNSDGVGWNDPVEYDNVANGLRDQSFKNVVDALKNNNCPLALVRVGYESNGGYMQDFEGWDTTTQGRWRAAMIHVYDLLGSYAKSQGVNLLRCTCPAIEQGSPDINATWMDGTHYDIEGIDFYNGYWGSGDVTNVATRENFWSNMEGNGYGMDAAIARAKYNKKGIFIFEWGSSLNYNGAAHGIANDGPFWDYSAQRIADMRSQGVPFFGGAWWNVPAGDAPGSVFTDGSQPLVLSAIQSHLATYLGDDLQPLVTALATGTAATVTGTTTSTPTSPTPPASTTFPGDTTPASPNGTTTTTVGVRIYDGAYSYAITAGGQIAIGGTPDPSSSGVLKIGLFGGTIYQLNASGQTYTEPPTGKGGTLVPTGFPVLSTATTPTTKAAGPVAVTISSLARATPKGSLLVPTVDTSLPVGSRTQNLTLDDFVTYARQSGIFALASQSSSGAGLQNGVMLGGLSLPALTTGGAQYAGYLTAESGQGIVEVVTGTPATLIGSPTFGTDPNGHGWCQFNGTSQYAALGGTLPGLFHTVDQAFLYIVAEITNAALVEQYVMNVGNSALATTDTVNSANTVPYVGKVVVIFNDSGSAGKYAIFTVGRDATSFNVNSTLGATAGAPDLIRAHKFTASAAPTFSGDIRVNGEAVVTSGGSVPLTAYPNTFDTIWIGATPSGSGVQQYAAMKFRSALVVTVPNGTPLTATDDSAIAAALKARFGTP